MDVPRPIYDPNSIERKLYRGKNVFIVYQILVNKVVNKMNKKWVLAPIRNPTTVVAKEVNFTLNFYSPGVVTVHSAPAVALS